MHSLASPASSPELRPGAYEYSVHVRMSATTLELNKTSNLLIVRLLGCYSMGFTLLFLTVINLGPDHGDADKEFDNEV